MSRFLTFLAVCSIMYFYRTPKGVIMQDTNRASPHGSHMHNCTAHASEHQCIHFWADTHIWPLSSPQPTGSQHSNQSCEQWRALISMLDTDHRKAAAMQLGNLIMFVLFLRSSLDFSQMRYTSFMLLPSRDFSRASESKFWYLEIGLSKKLLYDFTGLN